MPNNKNNLYLYEALELRAEYDARIEELRALLPEAKGAIRYLRSSERSYRAVWRSESSGILTP